MEPKGHTNIVEIQKLYIPLDLRNNVSKFHGKNYSSEHRYYDYIS